jgi:hypothetical protein
MVRRFDELLVAAYQLPYNALRDTSYMFLDLNLLKLLFLLSSLFSLLRNALSWLLSLLFAFFRFVIVVCCFVMVLLWCFGL